MMNIDEINGAINGFCNRIINTSKLSPDSINCELTAAQFEDGEALHTLTIYYRPQTESDNRILQANAFQSILEKGICNLGCLRRLYPVVYHEFV